MKKKYDQTVSLWDNEILAIDQANKKRKKSGKYIRLICKECANALHADSYDPKTLYKGICNVCNNEKMVTDPNNFGLKLR